MGHSAFCDFDDCCCPEPVAEPAVCWMCGGTAGQVLPETVCWKEQCEYCGEELPVLGEVG